MAGMICWLGSDACAGEWRGIASSLALARPVEVVSVGGAGSEYFDKLHQTRSPLLLHLTSQCLDFTSSNAS